MIRYIKHIILRYILIQKIDESFDSDQQLQICRSKIKMLKFLQNEQSNRLTTKPLVKYQPEMIYGHTEQSPNHFINRHTIYFNSTQQSSFQKKLENQLPAVQNNDKRDMKNAFRHSSQQFNISSQYRKTESRERSKKIKRVTDGEFNKEFNITKGEFSIFLDKHKHYGNLGIIHKENQTNPMPTQTQSVHKFNWNKSSHTESKSFQNNSIIKSKISFPSQTVEADKSLLNNSKHSTFGMTRSNSISILEKVAKKSQLKLKRDEFIGLMRKEAKEKLDKKYQTFGLPRIGVDHELFLLEKKKTQKKQQGSELQELNSDISKFQKSLYYKFK